MLARVQRKRQPCFEYGCKKVRNMWKGNAVKEVIFATVLLYGLSSGVAEAALRRAVAALHEKENKMHVVWS